jgi:4-amino-4-deoxy-L-arabinose transferase-like glycosyltransferase
MGLRFPSASPCEAGFAEQGAAGDAPGFLHEFFIGEHVGRATRAGFGRHLAPGILVGILLVGFFPWTLLVPGMVRETLVSAWRRRRTRPGPLLVFIWAGLVVLLFSLSRTQMLHYVLPAFPALALAAGGYLSDALSRPVASSLRPCVPSSLRFALWACAPLGAGGAAALAAIHTVGGGGPMPIVLLAAAMAAVAAASVACLLRRREDLSLALVPAGAAVLITFTFATDPFAVYSAFTTRPQAEIIRASVRPGDAVLSYGHTPYSLAWYLWPREVPCPTKTGKPWEAPSLGALVAQLNGPRRTFCLLRKKGLVEVLRPQVRWPLEVLSRSERSTLIVTAPPPGETSGPLLPAPDIHTRIP